MALEAHLRLYIAGRTPRSESAIRNLQRLCEDVIDAECEVEIVDVLDEPERAEEDKILVTPTLIKLSPQPVRRILGDLSDMDAVLSGLGLPTVSSGRTS